MSFSWNFSSIFKNMKFYKTVFLFFKSWFFKSRLSNKSSYRIKISLLLKRNISSTSSRCLQGCASRLQNLGGGLKPAWFSILIVFCVSELFLLCLLPLSFPSHGYNCGWFYSEVSLWVKSARDKQKKSLESREKKKSRNNYGKQLSLTKTLPYVSTMNVRT